MMSLGPMLELALFPPFSAEGSSLAPSYLPAISSLINEIEMLGHQPLEGW
jgi:hypothetical protein